MREENAELRKRLGMTIPHTLQTWETLMPQRQRDGFAARALMAENGHQLRALIRLGFQLDERLYGDKEKVEQVFALANAIFGTPGVQEILERDLSRPDEVRGAILERLTQIALYGSDADSVKSATTLARTCGWQKPSDVYVTRNQTNILALVTQKNSKGQSPAEVIQALPTQEGFLSHEPGAPKRIDTGDLPASVGLRDEQ